MKQKYKDSINVAKESAYSFLKEDSTWMFKYAVSVKLKKGLQIYLYCNNLRECENKKDILTVEMSDGRFAIALDTHYANLALCCEDGDTYKGTIAKAIWSNISIYHDKCGDVERLKEDGEFTDGLTTNGKMKKKDRIKWLQDTKLCDDYYTSFIRSISGPCRLVLSPGTFHKIKSNRYCIPAFILDFREDMLTYYDTDTPSSDRDCKSYRLSEFLMSGGKLNGYAPGQVGFSAELPSGLAIVESDSKYMHGV